MEKEENHTREGDAPLEMLRVDHTDMSREEFVVNLGISMSTYRRWLSGKTLPKFTLEQIVSACRMCEISLDVFFQIMGVEIDDVLRREPTGQRPGPSNEHRSVEEIHSLEMTPVATVISAARKLNVSLKALCGAFGIDTTGIPDDYPQSKKSESPEGEQEKI
ncbi:MAG: helix-turn-helix domain-containing protein [Hormoscilla sp.]